MVLPHLKCSNFTFTSAVNSDSTFAPKVDTAEAENAFKQKINYEAQVASKINSLNFYDLQKRDIFGRTFLHYVCLTGRDDILIKLLKKYYGGKGGTKNYNNDTAKQNFNLNVPDLENGYNCLHYSVYYGNFSCIKVLLQSNLIDPKTRDELLNSKDREGLTPTDLLYFMCDQKSFKKIPVSIGLPDDHYNTSIIGFNTIDRFGAVIIDEEKAEQAISADTVPIVKEPFNSLTQIDSSYWWNELRGASDLFMFGSNVNNTLGCGDAEDRLDAPIKIKSSSFNVYRESAPITLSERLAEPRIKDIKISKFHSVLITTDQSNNIFICGNNKLGRLGLQTNSTAPKYSFVPISFFENIHIQKIDLSDDHTLALDSNGRVYSWGSNEHGQLGYKDETLTSGYSNVPEKLNFSDFGKDKILGVSCSKIHSVAFSNKSLYVWGLNIGQFGFQSSGDSIRYKNFKKAVIQESPMQMQISYGLIDQVLALEFATIILMEDSCDIHIYMNSFHAKLQPPLILRQFKNDKKNDQFDLFEFKAAGSKRKVIKICGKQKVVALLYENGYILTFSLDEDAANSSALLTSINYSVAWRPKGKNMIATDMDISDDGSLILTTNEGIVFRKTFGFGKRSKESKATRVHTLDRIVKVRCDPLFATFGFLQDSIDSLPLELPKSSLFEDMKAISPTTSYLSDASDDFPNKDQTLNTHNSDFFTQYFLQRQKIIKHDDFDGLEMIFDNQKEDSTTEYNLRLAKNKHDMLYRLYMDRWCLRKHIASKMYSKNHTQSVHGAEDFLRAEKQVLELNIRSLFDPTQWSIQIGKITILVDAAILASRSPVLCDLFTKNGMIEEDDIAVSSNLDSKTLTISNSANLLSVLILLHYMHTDEEVYIWDEYPVGSLAPDFIQKTKRVILKLGKMLGVVNALDKFKCQKTFTDSLVSLIADKLFIPLLDTRIELSDGQLYASSSILAQRSDFFKRSLSGLWCKTADDNKKVFAFQDITCKNFAVVLRYLYGEDPLKIFDNYKELTDKYSVINFALEIIDICDELLILDLKDYCQYYICELIDSENVCLLVELAKRFNAKKLFEQCCWYIFNNVTDILINHMFASKSLGQSICYRLDRYFKFFYSLKSGKNLSKDFNDYKHKNVSKTLYEFLFDLQRHNEKFMSAGSSFEPLVDLLVNEKLVSEKLSKLRRSFSGKQRRKNSIDNSLDNVVGGQQASFSNPSFDKSLLFSFQETGFSHINDSVIDDAEEATDDFVPVSNRRRKSSTKNVYRMSSVEGVSQANGDLKDMPKTPLALPNLDIVVGSSSPLSSTSSLPTAKRTSPPPMSSSQQTQTRAPSISVASEQAWPTLATNMAANNDEKMSTGTRAYGGGLKKEKKKIVIGGMGRGSATAGKTPINIFAADASKDKPPTNPWATSKPSSHNSANSSTTSLSLGSVGTTVSSSTVAKTNRLNQTNVNVVGTSASIIPRPKTASLNFGPKKEEDFFPSLAELTKPKEDPGSLAAIMLAEELELQRKREAEASRKTLAEIQQEEEFNRWFEEESKRFQKELGIATEDIGQSKKKGKSKMNNQNKKKTVSLANTGQKDNSSADKGKDKAKPRFQNKKKADTGNKGSSFDKNGKGKVAEPDKNRKGKITDNNSKSKKVDNNKSNKKPIDTNADKSKSQNGNDNKHPKRQQPHRRDDHGFGSEGRRSSSTIRIQTPV